MSIPFSSSVEDGSVPSPLAKAQEGKSSSQHGDLPAEIYIPLVDALYSDIKSLYIGSAAAAAAATLVAFKTGEGLIFLCALAILIVTAARAFDMRAYKKIRPQLSTVKEVRHWEDRYTIGAAVYAALLGGWTFITFYLTTDPFSWLFSFVVTLAYLVGTPGRNFASNRLVTAQIIGEGVPLSAALFYAGGFYYAVFGLVLLPFFLALKFISDRLRRTLLDAVIANRDVGLLAKRFDTALNNMPHGLAMFDADGRLLVVNHRLTEIMSLTPSLDRVGQSVREFLRESVAAGKVLRSEIDDLAGDIEMRLAARVPGELTSQHPDGTTLTHTFQPMENGGSVVVTEDITSKRAAEAKIDRLARFDTLTGLPNRTHMSELMQAEFGALDRRSCAVLFVDIDGFKQVNDTLGHQHGDTLLRIVADKLRAIIREPDVIARFGGDEFVVMQVGVSGREDAEALAQRIIDTLTGRYDVSGNEVVVGATVGIALSPRDASGVDQILKIADMALYWAKQDNRGSYSFFEPSMDERAHARRALELDLREALANDAFEVHFQPIIGLGGRKLASCEALARWPHPERGMVPPSEFVPVAEEMGLIADLGEQVLRRACKAASDWPEDVRVAVNLSVVQFKSGDIVESIRQAIVDANLAPHRLEVEITESLFLQNTDVVQQQLQAIRDLGVRISLDDFGTGYSNLGYLHSLPLNKLKIDRSFVPDDVSDEKRMVLLKSMASLGKQLGLTVTVEGIETPEQLSVMMDNPDVSEVQGFLFSPAIPAREIATLLDAGTIRKRMAA